MEALAAMGDRLNQSLDAFSKHLTSMDSSIQHSEAEMGERLTAMARRIEKLEVKHTTKGPSILQVNEPQGSLHPSSTSNARRASLIPHGGDAEEVLPSDAAEPSTEARRAFLSRATKPMNVVLQGQSNFAAWSFALRTALLIVNLGDYVLRQAPEPTWLAQHPEIKKAAYILVVSSLSPSQSALIQNQAPNPRAVYRHLFQAIMGGVVGHYLG